MSEFNYWKNLHDSNMFDEFNHSSEGILWLKVKSITKSGYLKEFITNRELPIIAKLQNEQSMSLFSLLSQNLAVSHQLLNDYFVDQYFKEIASFKLDDLVAELYKVETFNWGGDNSNDIGKFLIKKYVKDNMSYDFLIKSIDNTVMRSVQDYLVCSWYNLWTSIIIEHIFKQHDSVLPTLGKIQSVDFFINEIPFDLKVTYLPTNLIEKSRNEDGKKSELTCLKNTADKLKIAYDKGTIPKVMYYSLKERLIDNNSDEALATLKEIHDYRISLIKKIRSNPMILAKNLYEKQSKFRFEAENRLFLILIDSTNFEDSWKLKRNIDLIIPGINKYLDEFSSKRILDLELTFHKEGDKVKYPKEYRVLTDVIILEKS